MPIPVAALLKSPSITMIFCLTGSSPDKVLLSFIPAPEPSALQWSSLIPLPMNRTAKRFGKAAGGGVSAKAVKEGSLGNAMETPAPRRTVRQGKGGGKGGG